MSRMVNNSYRIPVVATIIFLLYAMSAYRSKYLESLSRIDELSKELKELHVKTAAELAERKSVDCPKVSVLNNEAALDKNALATHGDVEIYRDLLRYKCKNVKRIGGWQQFLSKVPHELFRTEGAWFVCFDPGFAPLNNSCTVLSFGVNTDESFDKQMNAEYGCRVESFDPYVENPFFEEIRKRNASLQGAVTLHVNSKWRFHRIGISNAAKSSNENRIGRMATFKQIIDYTGLNEQVIDVLKMDIEKYEWMVLDDMNIDYLCKYVKQFELETHSNNILLDVISDADTHLGLLKKLEKCFVLYHRDTRFYREDASEPYGFWKTEFQEPITYQIPLADYKTVEKLFEFMITYGELYFVNINFKK